nr:hypothetical protein [Cupriavidus sp. IDO]
MAQQVSDLLERRATLHHAAGRGTSENMRTPNALLQVAAFGGVACVANDIQTCRCIDWWAMAHEQLAASRRGTVVAQIICNRLACRPWKWQDVDPLALAVNAQRAGPPVHIVQLQVCHFCATQAQVQQTAGDRVVALASGGLAIEGIEELLDLDGRICR